ncbi:MAG: chromosome segregation protein SMC, partial [Armatimonadota bacterium]
LNKEIKNQKEDLIKQKDVLRHLQDKKLKLNQNITAKSSRLKTLNEMSEAHEGFYEGVRNVMNAVKDAKLESGYAVVADVISVPKGYEQAIETALGASLQDIITDNLYSAKKAITYLKENKLGRATFLPLDNMKPIIFDSSYKLKNINGALGIASEIISYDLKYNPAINTLLGRTIIADNIDNAINISHKLNGWSKIVTIDGEVLVPSGALTGGSAKSKGSGLLLRKQEIETLGIEIREIETEILKINIEIENNIQEINDTEQKIEFNEQKLNENKSKFSDSTIQIEYHENEISRIIRQIDSIELESEEISLMLKDEKDKIESLEKELIISDKENTNLDQIVSDAERKIEELSKIKENLIEKQTELRVKLAECKERSASIENGLHTSNETLNQLKNDLDERKRKKSDFADEIEKLELELLSITQEMNTQKALFNASDVSLKDISEKRATHSEKFMHLQKQLRDSQNDLIRISQEMHDIDVKEARLDMQLSQLTERLYNEYEISLNEALEFPDNELVVERGASVEVARLRKEIRDMGAVNTGAIGEYERIKDRWDFLTEQKIDLEKAKIQVNEAITEIDSGTKEIFMDTFNKVSENFDKMFNILFGGGKTQLKLTMPDNLLETGIDIIAQMPGKKFQDMSLLSGGERALTACALIFALLLAKPSPFVVMDEVDAPLDESNVERFADVLNEFSKNSQFIVITHNRATMEASDMLYGVTMQEPGVSKLISVKLTSEDDAEKNNKSEREVIKIK